MPVQLGSIGGGIVLFLSPLGTLVCGFVKSKEIYVQVYTHRIQTKTIRNQKKTTAA